MRLVEIMVLGVEFIKRILYTNTFCAYRDKYMNRIICRHKYSYGICDLDLCPIFNDRYANIIFQEDGLVLVVKKPSDEYVAGVWERHKIEVSPELNNDEEIISFCMERIDGISEKIKEALIGKLRNILSRWRFLRARGKRVGILEKKEEKPEAGSEEAVEEEELMKELEKWEEELGEVEEEEAGGEERKQADEQQE